MNAKHLILVSLTAALVTIAPNPLEAGGSFGIHISNHGVGIGFGGANWGIWGSSWNSGQLSAGFSATLDGYGEWVSVAGLGRVWRPWVAAGWQPYSHGRWVWTSLGWTWVAYEPWGWVPHHYGNWAFTTVGWVWTPGYSYHPGNVLWVSSGAYIGWIPCAPRGWSHAHRAYDRGWHDGYRSGRYDGYNQGYEDGWRDARYATWVPNNDMTSDNVSHHAVGHDVVTRTAARGRIVPLATPPSKANVERMVGRAVPESRIVERTTTISGHDVRVVRPEGQLETVRRHSAETVKTALAPSARERAVGVPSSRTHATASSPRAMNTSGRNREIQRRDPPSRAVTVKTRTRTTTTTVSRRSTGSSAADRNRDVAVTRSRFERDRGSIQQPAVGVPSRQVERRAPQTQPNRLPSRTASPSEPTTASSGARAQRSTADSSAAKTNTTRVRSSRSGTQPEKKEPAKRRQRSRN